MCNAREPSRPLMFRLSNNHPPNPRLQRTRLRSPLSRKPFGVFP